MFGIRIDVHIHQVDDSEQLRLLRAIGARLVGVVGTLKTIQQEGVKMQQSIDEVKREAEETNAKLVEVSGVLNALVDKIVEAQDDPAELQAIAAALDAGQQGVQPALDRAKAVLAPQQPEEPPAPTE